MNGNPVSSLAYGAPDASCACTAATAGASGIFSSSSVGK